MRIMETISEVLHMITGAILGAGSLLSLFVSIRLGNYLGLIISVLGVTSSIYIFKIDPGSRRVSHPPAWGLRRFAELCFSKKTLTEVLDPTLIDMQKEHFEALAARHPWKARMVLVRGYWAFWSAVAAQLPISLARRIYEVWKATGS